MWINGCTYPYIPVHTKWITNAYDMHTEYVPITSTYRILKYWKTECIPDTYTVDWNLFAMKYFCDFFCECSKSQKYDRKKFQWLYSDYSWDEFSQKISIAKIFPSKFPAIFANIFQHKIIPVYSKWKVHVYICIHIYCMHAKIFGKENWTYAIVHFLRNQCPVLKYYSFTAMIPVVNFNFLLITSDWPDSTDRETDSTAAAHSSSACDRGERWETGSGGHPAGI